MCDIRERSFQDDSEIVKVELSLTFWGRPRAGSERSFGFGLLQVKVSSRKCKI